MKLTTLEITSPRLVIEHAEAIFNFVRRSFMQNYKKPRVIGMKVVNLKNQGSGPLNEYATFPGSTDLVLDLKMQLCSADYEVVQAKRSDVLKKNDEWGNSISLLNKGDSSLTVIRIIKSFESAEALTYRDLQPMFTFYGVDDLDQPLIHIMDHTALMEFTFFVQMSTELQDEGRNMLELAYLLGDGATVIPIASSSMEKIFLHADITKTTARMHVTGVSNNKQLPIIQEILKDRLEKAIDLYEAPII